jgi:outer membrane protein assembly factor BamB
MEGSSRMETIRRKKNTFALGLGAALVAGTLAVSRADVKGWLNWRGPAGTGVSTEKGLPDKIADANGALWQYNIAGGGSPVIANGKLYGLGYRGQGPDLQEVLFCLNADTGKLLWEHGFNDFLSDITYDRYAIGSPCVDPETGNVYTTTSAGVFACFTGDGKPVFQHSLMEGLGRLTFTNGRTGGPTIEQDLVIVRYVTSNWGGEGAAMDRFYGYDKKTGKLVWSCSPGVAPKDNSFSRPIFSWQNGKRVFYAGTGDGSVICANARTGETYWRYPISAGGMNATVVLTKNAVVAIHAEENLDSSDKGRMTAIKMDATPKPPEAGSTSPTPMLDRNAEAWRNNLHATSSSPVIVGNRIYQVINTGQLCSVDAETGKILWEYKLGTDQLHASPTYADGKLYIPIQNGQFFIVRPKEDGAELLSQTQLAGRAIGAPAVANGKVYVFTTEKLYCFGTKGKGGAVPAVAAEKYPKPGPTVALQIMPAEVLLRPGQKANFTIRGIDANGFVTQTFDAKQAKWEKYIPPTARVKSEMNGSFDANGGLTAGAEQKPSAGAFQATIGNFKGTIRGRVLPALPYTENFEAFTPSEMAPDGGTYAYPPLPWIGARFKFDIREVDGNKVFAKTLDNIFFQRATVFFGAPDDSNYTMEADIMVDGNRRTRSTVGLINQRYLVALLGNEDKVEISSNQERVKIAVPFKITPKIWYHMKTRVDVATDGSGVVRAKVWKKGEAEPAEWTIEAPHQVAHKSGAAGLYGFAPQSLFKVYIDNIAVTPNSRS